MKNMIEEIKKALDSYNGEWKEKKGVWIFANKIKRLIISQLFRFTKFDWRLEIDSNVVHC